MILPNLFKSQPLLDEASRIWLLDSFDWAERNLDGAFFRQETILVTPSNRHFPGRADSIEGMAQLILDRVKAYAGMGHWPTELVDASRCAVNSAPRPQIAGVLRRPGGGSPEVAADERLPIPYDPAMVNNPEAMIAAFAHTLAHYLGQTAAEPPPGGAENWPHLTEVVAIFLGFGPMVANSAFNVRLSGCGSCGTASADRQSFLSQYDTTYALAIFAKRKGIANRALLPHLKKPLRGFYKRAARELLRSAD